MRLKSLQALMARHGFESNDDYEYQIRCLLQNPVDKLRCLNVEGGSNRRKTAFAMALAEALAYPHTLYHDFTQQKPPLRESILPPSRDEHGLQPTPIDPLDQILSEACAFSEAEGTLLVLDQLQAADFREHIRLYKFLQTARWVTPDHAYFANPDHLLVFLLSDQPLYHSLQKSSFRVWVNDVSNRRVDYQPQDFDLGDEARGLFEALAELFVLLGLSPTRTEYFKLLHDIHTLVRSREDLRNSIYGWTEGVDRQLLFSPRLLPQLDQVIAALFVYLHVDVLELKTLDGEATTPIDRHHPRV